MPETREKWRKRIWAWLPAAILSGLVLWQYPSYSEMVKTQPGMLDLSVITLIVLVIARHVRVKPEAEWYTLYQAAVFFAGPMIMVTAVEVLNGNMIWALAVRIDILLNYLSALLLYVVLYVLLGRVTSSGRTASVILLVFGIANMYLKDYKGSPLLPMDLGSIRTAANVAASFTYTINCRIITALCLTMLSWSLLGKLPMDRAGRKRQRAERLLGLALVLGISYVFYETDTFSDNFMRPDFFNQTRGYETHGSWAEFLLNTKYLFMSEPDGYSAEAVQEYLDTMGETGSVYETAMKKQGDPVASWTGTQEKPDIFVIMNESYSDLSVIGDFGTNIPYMPYADSLIGQENVIEGNVYVSTIGTGTSNTEFEFLTGNTMAFLPGGSNAYQLYVDHEMPGLVTVLKDQEYFASAVHPYYKSSWNRVSVYNDMHFDEFIGIEDMKDYVKVRRFVSDEWDFQELIRMYENKGDDPLFVFNITMQNHSSYEIGYENFPQRVWLTSTEGEYPETDQYLSLIRATDDAFKDLIEYFSKQEKPVILLMFGDHQPFIEDKFYEEVMGQRLNDMSDETQQKRYITRFILWANYDIPEGYIDQISVNYLSSLMMEFTGLQTSPYQDWLSGMYGEVPVITAMGCRDFAGNFFQADESSSHNDAMKAYRAIAYNDLFDKKNRIEAFFSVRKKD